MRNPPLCGICHRGSAKIGSRCIACHRALFWSAPQSGQRAGGKRAPGTKTLLEERRMTQEDCCHTGTCEERIPSLAPLHATNHE
jgi:hypothetical protein